jgi:hypothetical protein
VSGWDKEQIKESLGRLKDINQKNYNELWSNKAVLHFHPVIWEETTEKKGFPYKQANDMEAFQFSLLGINHQKARVYGAYSGDTFYIVWFDLNHEIWPTFKKWT